ncbi:MAG: ELWxxDGT repeat protein, partial [Pleurocapsa sp.]
MDTNQGNVVLVKDIFPGTSEYYETGVPYTNSSDPASFIEYKGKIYFTARSEDIGIEIRETDGTTEGTMLLAEVIPGNNAYSSRIPGNYPNNLIEFDGKIYFTPAIEFDSNIWMSDGTTEGTSVAIDFVNGSADDPSPYYINDLIEANDQLYFTALSEDAGVELWVTQVSVETTIIVSDINPVFNDSLISILIEFDNKLYFNATDGANGNELWVTDGTANGTQLVADINSGSGSSNPRDFAEYNGKLYFSA